MNKVRKLLTAALFCAATALSALEGRLIPTLSLNIRDQMTGLLPARRIYAAPCDRLARGQQCRLYFNVGKATAKEGRISVSGTLTATDAQGKKTTVFQDKLLFDFARKDPSRVFTSPTEIGIEFEETDPVGGYRWDLTLKDNNSGETCQVKSVSIELTQEPSDLQPMAEKEWDTFITAYYMHPAPQRIMAALKYFLTVKDAEYKKSVKNYNPLILLSGFAQLFRINRYLWPQLGKYGKTLKKEHFKYFALLVNGIGSDAVGALKNDLPEEVQKLIVSLNRRNPLYAGNPTKLYHLDMLWMEFCVTGRKAPVIKIANEMRKREIMTLDQVKAKHAKQEKLTPAEQQKLLNYLMSVSAYNLISSSRKRGHALPGYYIEAMAVRKELDPVVSALAVMALKKGSVNPK